MKAFLILRLLNAAYACDAKGNHNLAALIHEAIKEIENGEIRRPAGETPGREGMVNTGHGSSA
jgi:hypothetical protein